jgi:DNA helicase IV
MEQERKEILLKEAQENIKVVAEDLKEELELSKKQLAKAEKERSNHSLSYDAQVVASAIANSSKDRVEEVQELINSPYFSRIDASFSDTPAKSYYIGKFSSQNQSIYSWTAPIATLRFQEPGKVSYETPKAGPRKGEMSRVDQYAISNGSLLFMASQQLGSARELIYQEHFTTRKNAFILPEVVAQMERAQDEIIRADHKGPLVVAGPAGSGKTTLALHRVAYLRQYPETAHLYPKGAVAIFVQDQRTKDYFAHLLPELGIHDIPITTFPEWGFAQLGLTGHTYDFSNDQKGLTIEIGKLRALREGDFPQLRTGNLPLFLAALYEKFLTQEDLELVKARVKSKVLDRFDLTAILSAHLKQNGPFIKQTKRAVFTQKGKVRTITERSPLRYSLMVVDEFENYLPEQLAILKQVIDKTQSVIYVGDMAQKTQLGSINDFSEIGESIPNQRNITLQKVYRNTFEILDYINSLGYDIKVPNGLRHGEKVAVREFNSPEEEQQKVLSLVKELKGTVGILAKTAAYLESYKKHFSDCQAILCMTVREAQGVEFEHVLIVGAGFESWGGDVIEGSEKEELQKIDRDSLYVALTRAISSLHIFGNLGAEEHFKKIANTEKLIASFPDTIPS